jgi:5-bromo-4-chloroindolyl phosphate hydrolysis protein
LVTELKEKVGELNNQLLAQKETSNASQNQVIYLKKQLEDSHERLQESNKLIANNQEVKTLFNHLNVTFFLFTIIYR